MPHLLGGRPRVCPSLPEYEVMLAPIIKLWHIYLYTVHAVLETAYEYRTPIHTHILLQPIYSAQVHHMNIQRTANTSAVNSESTVLTQ